MIQAHDRHDDLPENLLIYIHKRVSTLHLALELDLVQLIAPVYVLVFVLVVELRLQRHAHRHTVLKHHDQQELRPVLVLIRIGLQCLVVERVPRASVVVVLIRIVADREANSLHAHTPGRRKVGMEKESELESILKGKMKRETENFRTGTLLGSL